MKKSKVVTILVSIFSVVFVFLFLIGGSIGITAYSLLLKRYHGTPIIDNFDPNQPFDLSKIKVVEKKKDKDFVILNLADVQMCDLEDIPHQHIIKEEIKELIDRSKPDLITLTGDQTWSNENLISITSLVRWLDEFKTPYAPVFGNHDFGNEDNNAVFDNLKCCETYENGKYSLFSRGPSNLDSIGNYVINIKEDDKIIKTLYMMDFGVNYSFSLKQIEWLAYNADHLKEINNNEYVSSMIFSHKPISQFYEAYFNGDDSEIIIDKAKALYEEDNDDLMYETAKSHGVGDFVCGHNHWFHFSCLNSDNVRFTMSLKTGELGGYLKGDNTYLNGATSFHISEDSVSIYDYYVSYDKYHIA